MLQPPSGGFGLTIFINVYNSIFYFVLISVAYAVVRLLLSVPYHQAEPYRSAIHDLVCNSAVPNA